MGPEAGGRRTGRYEVELPITEGALGRAFLARGPVLGRRVALKVLRADVGSAEDRARLAERVRERVRAFAALTHATFGALHDVGDDGGDLYVVLEFVPGPTLAERVASGPLPPAEVAVIGRAL